MYDIVYIGPKNQQWINLKNKFITAKHAESFEQARSIVFTKMFWVIWPDIIVNDEFDFAYKADEYSLDITHVFRNGKHFDGICLFPKHIQLHKKELDYRFFTEKKEVDIVASNPSRYSIITVKDYQDYQTKLATCKSDFVYVVPERINVEYNFEYTVPYNEKDLTHVFKNGKYYDGIFLQHKNKVISKHEFEYSWYTNKKEIDIIASTPKPYDIVFISYNEPNADTNYAALQQHFPRAKRIHGIKGIHQAHIAAAKLCDTDMFWIVDGDAQIADGFNFDFQSPKWQRDNVYVWRSINPINDLVYGYGGIKLFPRKETLNMDTSKPDMTTSISSKFNAMPQISNITAFNTDPFNTWKSAFRECAKLSSKVIDRQENDETDERLETWTTVGHNRPFGEYAIQGARAGMEFGLAQRDNLGLINDFEWLKNKFYEDQKLIANNIYRVITGAKFYR